MPLYSFVCPSHGEFEQFKLVLQRDDGQTCPKCRMASVRVISMPAISFIQKERLEYGSGSYGKIVSHKETGGLDIFVPSFGALEQDEVDYVAMAAVEKEKDRVKKRKGPRNETQARIQAYGELARSAKPGKRAETLRKAIAETGDKVRC